MIGFIDFKTHQSQQPFIIQFVRSESHGLLMQTDKYKSNEIQS